MYPMASFNCETSVKMFIIFTAKCCCNVLISTAQMRRIILVHSKEERKRSGIDSIKYRTPDPGQRMGK